MRILRRSAEAEAEARSRPHSYSSAYPGIRIKFQIKVFYDCGETWVCKTMKFKLFVQSFRGRPACGSSVASTTEDRASAQSSSSNSSSSSAVPRRGRCWRG